MTAKAPQSEPPNKQHHAEFDKIVDGLKGKLFIGLETLMDGMFDGADDTLFALAEKADSNQLQQIYFETMRMLRLERTDIKHGFATILGESFTPRTQKFDSDSHASFDEDELSLVDQDSMEEMVAISGMHTKAMQNFKEEILHLNKRIEFLAENTPNIFHKEAIEPKNICESFRDAIAPIGEQIEIQNKLILYKLFDNKLMAELGSLYRELNNFLISSGVMPKISVGQLVGKRIGGGLTGPRQSYVNPAESQLSVDPRLQAFEESNYSQYQSQHPGAMDYQSVQVLSQFLQDSVGGKPAQPPQNTQENFLSTGDVLSGLSQLQSQSSDQFATPQELKQALQAEVGKRNSAQANYEVSQLDEKTIDLIQLLFDAMFEDDDISDAIQSLILRLQIPVIKSAMLDANFFTDQFHPSRNVLNRLANAGTTVTSEDDSLYPKIESVVDGIVQNFDQDVVAFQVALDQLNKVIHEDEVKAREEEAATQKQVLRQHARKIVLRELKSNIRGRNFPKAAHKLVLKHWSTLMYHKYIKYGKDSKQWFSSVDTLKEIIGGLQLSDISDSADVLAARFADLTQKVEDELLGEKYDRVDVLDSVADLRDSLAFTVEDILRKETESPAEPTATAAEQESEISSGPEIADEPSDPESDKPENTNAAPDESSTFPSMLPEFDLSHESAEDIATAMALGIGDLLPELKNHVQEPDQSAPATGASTDAAEPIDDLETLTPTDDKAISDDSTVLDETHREPEAFDLDSTEFRDTPTYDEHSADLKPDQTPELDTEVEVDEESETDQTPETAIHADSVTDNAEQEGYPEQDASSDDPSESPEVSNKETKSETSEHHSGVTVISVQEMLRSLPEDIKPGTWINLYTGYREPEIRAKLSVVIPESELLVFVDREGFKAAEKQLDEFRTELEEGLSSVVVEHSAFDKALSSVISNLSAY
ncbi:MAG: DUF1631 family protein [Pseudomonadota bacterium]